MNKKAYLSVLCFSLSVTLSAQENSSLRLKHFNLTKSLALQGYDAVSYFDKKPQKGKTSIRYTYNGIVYQFVSTQNLEKFKLNPSGYEPAYGGWCAYAMGARNEKVEVDPETYKIIQGKVYLFYNAFFNNTLTDWNKNEIVLKQKADTNWKKIIAVQ
jgi:YHS domain-containing protein